MATSINFIKSKSMATITVNVDDIDKALQRLNAGYRFYETVSKLTILDEGEPREKQVQLLVGARDCAEAEQITIAELTPLVYLSGVDVISAKLSKYSEAHDGETNFKVPMVGESPKWYGVKINYIQVSDKGKQKKTPAYYLFYAGSVQNANTVVDVFMMETVGDYEVASISETKIEDVIYPCDNE